MYETNSGDLRVQLGQLSTIVDSRDMSFREIIKITTNFGKKLWLEMLNARDS